MLRKANKQLQKLPEDIQDIVLESLETLESKGGLQMKAVTIHHRLADIRITPLAVSRVSALKEVILHALDDYVDQDTVALAKIRARAKMRHGAAFETPGYYLRIYRNRSDLTQAALAKKINVRQHHISEMENNKRSIGKELAKKLAAVLSCDYRKFR